MGLLIVRVTHHAIYPDHRQSREDTERDNSSSAGKRRSKEKRVRAKTEGRAVITNLIRKRRVNPGLGFFSFNTARRTISGYETMNIIRKGQIEGVGKGDIRGQVRLVSSLFSIAV